MIMDRRWLLWNLILTQLLLTVLAVCLLWVQGRFTVKLWMPAGPEVWGIGLLIGLLVISLEWGLYQLVPPDWMDDGGLNRFLFQRLSIWEIFALAVWVAVAEEILFRGALQYWLGITGTSLLFTFVHFRYLKRWLLMVMLFAVSLLLGWVTEQTGSLVSAICAHFVLNFIGGLLIRHFSASD